MTLSKNLFTTVAIATLASLAGAQYTSETIANSYTSILGTGTNFTGSLPSLDDAGTSVPLGFSFDFYGTAVTAVSACTNGYLTTGATLNDFTPGCLGVDDGTNALIAPFWADLRLNEHGDMLVETTGTAGSQVTTIQWEDCGGFQNTLSSYNFQVKMYEGSNDIEFHYGTIDGALNPSDGSDAVIGVENDDATASTQVSCLTAVDLTTGYRIFVPAIAPAAHSAPAGACIGDTVTISGSGEPGHFFAIAVSASNGPTGPLDLGADYINNIIGTGVIDAMGSTGDITIGVPASIACGSMGFSQMVTIGGFAPITGVSISPSVGTAFNSCQTFLGTLDTDDETSDHYDFTGTAGDVLTITLCRIGDQMDGSSLLDPRLCVYDAGTTIGSGQGVEDDDDSNGDCFATGPFGASIIEDWMVPTTGDYTITASAWDGTEGPYELAVIGCTGTVTLSGDEITGGCFN